MANYNANIPRPTDKISVSQGDLLANFTAIGSLLTFPGANIPGTVRLNTLGVNAPPTMSATQWGLYAGPSALLPGNPTALFTQFPNIPPFDGDSSEAATSNYATPGFTTVPSGIILQWGTGTANDGTNPITFSIPFPANVFSVQATILAIGETGSVPKDMIKIVNLSTTGFYAISSSVTGNFESRLINYLAIGY